MIRWFLTSSDVRARPGGRIDRAENAIACGCPPTSNRLTVAWYFNEPNNGERSNVGCTDRYDFFALHGIRPGVELTNVVP